MNTLLAPNGKPSNLTPEQYELVRKPEFKAWFGDWENKPNENMLTDENEEPMVWYHTGGNWTELNNNGINGKGKLMFSPTKSSMAYGNDEKKSITRPFFIKSDFIYKLPYEDRNISSAYRWNKNKKNPIWFVNAYGGFIVVRQSNQIKLADGTNTTFDGNNPDIRFDGGGETDLDNINLTTYIVRFDTDEDSESELVTTNFEDAKDRYDSIKIGDYGDGSFGVTLEKKVDTYKFVYELDEDESIDNYPIEEYYKYLYYYELIDEGEFEIIENRVVESYNNTSNDLLNELDNWAKNKFGNYKYNRIDVYSEDDENEENEPIGSIQLRISDHSQNENNLPYGIDKSLSVVIANKDATRGRFQQNKLQIYFSGDDSFEYVISEIENLLQELKQNIMENNSNKFAKGGKVNIIPADVQKFKKIGVEDKYIIEAINDIGLQNTKFDSDSINKAIENSFKELLKKSNDYIISQDSTAITNVILNEIKVKKIAGATDEYLEEYELKLTNPQDRKEYIDKFAETQKETIDEWVSYLKQSDYPVALKFLILKAVLTYNYDFKINDFRKRGDETIRNFTPFDAGSLSQLVAKKSMNLLEDYTNIQIENAVNIAKSKEFLKTSTGGSWLKFNGGSKTSEQEILNNSKELAQLVQNTYWCTKTNSKSQLDDGDFYVYTTTNNGEVFPRIAIRMDEDKVGEVRGNNSSAQDIEIEMLPIAKEFLTKNIPNNSGKKWLDSIDYNEQAIALNLKIESKGLFKNSVEEFIELKSKEQQNLLDYADRNGHIVRIEKLIEGLLPTLPNKFYGEKEVVINFSDFDNKKTKIIIGYADFNGSQVTDLRQLTTIGGDANFQGSQVTDLGQLTTIGGDADFEYSKITDLGQLTTIGGNAIFGGSKVTDLGQLTTIGGYADFNGSQIKDLGQLTTIGGNAYFRDSQIKDLGQLTTIGGYAEFENSQVTDLGQLTTIGGNAYFRDSQIKDLGKLTTIGDNAIFRNSQITDLGQLTTIGGSAIFRKSQVTDLGQLTTIGGDADFNGSQIKDLGQLTTIGGYAEFENSQVTDLGQLTTIGGYADFNGSQIKDLGQLTTIGGYAYFGDNVNLENQWKERQNKDIVNNSSDGKEKFAKGGKVIIQPADVQKYKKIGVEDKYIIESSKDVGLQGINFDSKNILKKIETEFQDMLKNYESYVINEDSDSITNYMNNEIEIKRDAGISIDELTKMEQDLNNQTARNQTIQQIAKTQKEGLIQWVDYLSQSQYNVSFKFLMLKAILNFNYDLKKNKLFQRGNDTIRNFTPFDAGSLAELENNKSDYLLFDYSVIMNENSIKALNSQEIIESSGNGKWIKFNGGKKTKDEDIEKNGTQLMRLTQNTYWCTSRAGTSQLRGGDFYVYVIESNGEIFPRIAVRMNENEVGELRGNNSSAQDLDAEMLPIAEKFLITNIPNNSGKKWLDAIIYNKSCVEMTKRLQLEGFYKDFIYDYIKLVSVKEKYKVEYGENGNVTNMIKEFDIQKNNLPNQYYNKSDFETNHIFLSQNTVYFIGDLGNYQLGFIKSHIENAGDIRGFTNFKLKLISGDLDVTQDVISLGNIEYVGGNLTLSKNTKDLGAIKYIGGEINMNQAEIDSLNNLESLGGDLIITSKLKDLGKLKKVNNLNIQSCDENFTLGSLEEIETDFIIANDLNVDFGNLKTIGGSFIGSKIKTTDLKNLESVGGDFNIAGSKIKLFPNLKNIGGNADFSNNFCSSTQNIETILGDIKFLNSRIMEFPKLNKIGGNIEFRGSYFKSFGNIKYIGGNLNFADSLIEELGDLEYIGGYASFKGSKIKSLNKLKKIVGFANFESSSVEDLGNLETLGGNAYFTNTKIKSLGKLNYVGGVIFIGTTTFKGLEGFYQEITETLNKK